MINSKSLDITSDHRNILENFRPTNMLACFGFGLSIRSGASGLVWKQKPEEELGSWAFNVGTRHSWYEYRKFIQLSRMLGKSGRLSTPIQHIYMIIKWTSAVNLTIATKHFSVEHLALRDINDYLSVNYIIYFGTNMRLFFLYLGATSLLLWLHLIQPKIYGGA